MKVQISLDDNLMTRIDAYADANYMSRSGLISLATAQFLNQAEMMLLIKEMSLAMRKIADSGKVDKDTLEKLEDLERFCKVAIGGK